MEAKTILHFFGTYILGVFLGGLTGFYIVFKELRKQQKKAIKNFDIKIIFHFLRKLGYSRNEKELIKILEEFKKENSSK